MTLRAVFRALAPVLATALLFPAMSAAKVYIDLAAPATRRLPVAIQGFKDLGALGDESSAVGRELVETLKSDLRFTELFEVIDEGSFIEKPSSGITAVETDFKDWRAIGADALVKGGFLVDNGRLTVEVRLFDCVTERQLVGKRYIGSADNPRKLMHSFSDALYEELTGRKGIFSTRLLYISDGSGNKEVYSSDYDGGNARRLTRNGSINLSPQWSPDGARVLYTSYKRGRPSLYMLDLTTGKETIVSDRPGINIGGRYSPDGNSIALALSAERSSELYIMDLVAGGLRRLTDNSWIDVSPSWSPDGKRLVFVSDSSGNPHLFMLDLHDMAVRRLTYDGRYNSSPAWSPDGSRIAFARELDGNFDIWVMRPDGTGESRLTYSGNSMNPSWSPDGMHIVYSSTVNRVTSLSIMRADGTGQTRLDAGQGNLSAPAWSPFLR